MPNPNTALVDPVTRGIRATSGLTGLSEVLPVLRDLSAQFESLGVQSRAALHRGDSAERERLLRERAEKIIEVTDAIVPTLLAKATPATLAVADRLGSLKAMAADALQTSTAPSHFCLQSLLTHMGATSDDPNDLQWLIQRIESGIAAEL